MAEEQRIESVQNKLNEERIIGEVGVHSNQGPTIIFVAGLHGNEQAGISALLQSMENLEHQSRAGKMKLRGKVYAVSGNLQALRQNKRYIDEDLNRMWLLSRVDRVHQKNDQESVEDAELTELLTCFEKILQESNGPFFFIDLHSTSSRTVPHIVINDQLENRKLSFRYPLPVILGIDSFVDGTMLSFVNEMGHRAIGFEGGRHNQPNTIDNIMAFFWLTLVNTGVLKKRQVPSYKEHFGRLLVASQGHRQVYEVFHHYQVDPDEDFEMVPGYNNFQPIVKGQYLADSGKNTILAQERGFVFLPRYEEKGSSGFFLLKQLTKSWLGWSAFLRTIKFEKVLALMPGVEKEQEVAGAYRVNQRIARFFAAEIFHLLGYRRVLRRNGELLLAKRSPKGSE